MEIIQRVPIDLEALADLLPTVSRKPSRPAPRDSSVWHVTSLLNSQQEIIRGRNVYSDSGGPPLGIMSLGKIWEHIADQFLTDYAHRLGGMFIPNVSMSRDSVHVSLDGVLYLPSIAPEPIISESKLRFTSSDAIPDSHLRQITCYCAVYDTCFVAYTVLRIGSKPPTAEAEVIFGHIPHNQITEMWSGVVKTKEYLESLGITPLGNKPSGIIGGKHANTNISIKP